MRLLMLLLLVLLSPPPSRSDAIATVISSRKPGFEGQCRRLLNSSGVAPPAPVRLERFRWIHFPKVRCLS